MAASPVPAYEFLSPARIVFGWGRLGEVGPLAAGLGRRAFLVVGSRTLAADGTLDALQDLLRQNRVEPIVLATIDREPLVADVDRSVSEIRRHRVREGDMVIGARRRLGHRPGQGRGGAGHQHGRRDRARTIWRASAAA